MNAGVDASPGQPATPPRPPVARRRWGLALLGALGLLLLMALALGWWAWRSPAAQGWALARVPGLVLQGQQGSATGGPFAVQRLQWEGAGRRVVVEGLAWDEARWRLRPAPGLWFGLRLQGARASSVTVQTLQPPAPDAPRSPAPTQLRLPFELAASGLRVGRVQLDTQPPLTELRADVHLSAAQGSQHRLQGLALQRAGLALAGSLVIGSGQGLPVQAQAQMKPVAQGPDPTAAGAAATPWQATLQASGPLERLQLQGALRLAEGAGATATASVAPFAAWPLLALAAQLEQLDLSSLDPALPQTRLSGSARLAPPGAAQTTGDPLVVSLALRNDAPGPLDAARLPLRSLQVLLRGRPAAPDTLQFETLQAELAGVRDAGSVRGEGTWQAGTLKARLQLQGLRPELLHGAAPAMLLDGSVGLLASGLPGGPAAAVATGSASTPASTPGPTPAPAPGPAPGRAPAPTPAPAPASASATASATGPAPAASSAAPAPVRQPAPSAAAVPMRQALDAEAVLQLTGWLPQRGTPPLALQATATLRLPGDGSLQASLRDLQASAGGTVGQAPQRASATLDATRQPAGDWQLRSTGSLRGFDPAPWVPSSPGAPRLVPGAQSLNGQWQAALVWLAAVPGQAAPPALARLRGEASFGLDDSRFANLAWRGQGALQAGADALQARAQLQAGPNRVQLEGRLLHASTGRAASALPQGSLDLQAPQLAALAPLAALLPASASAWWPREGALQAQASVQGQWPALRSSGSLRASGLRAPGAAVQQLQARWQLATESADAPLALQLQATGLARGAQRVQSLSASLEGSLRQHRLELRAASPVRPPAWAEAGPAAPGPEGSAFELQGSGSWVPAAAGGGTWRGAIAQLRAAPLGSPAAPWLAAQGLQATLQLDAANQPRSAELAPGRLEALGGALQWQQARWQAATQPGAPPRLSLRAQLLPLQLAPLLARLQPQFGWQGDLAVAGRFAIDSGERLQADVAIERTGGDLSLSVEGARRALDISDLRLGLQASNGLWQLTQALVGRSVGVVGGLQTIRTSPQALVPEAQAPLEGGLSLIVPQLQVWAPWLPPGWRLGGNLRIAAAFAGTAGAPEYRGSVTGDSLTVRNLFEGIHLAQGALAIALQGRQASIERFEFRDGTPSHQGLLRLTGQASMDESVRARLQLVAERMRLLDRYDRRVSASGRADIDLDTQGLRLGVRGAFTVDEGLIDATQADAPKLSGDVVVLNREPLPTPAGAASARAQAARGSAPAPEPGSVRAADAAGRGTGVVPPVSATSTGGARPAPAPPPPVLANADVDLRVDLGQALRLRGRGLDTLLRGQLRVSTPGGQLAVNGIVRAEEGTYTAYGQNLRIERGNLVFRGEVATPQLDILALRADIDQRVGVVVSGTPVNPRVRLYSEPELGQLDTLTWLVLGRAPEGLGRDDTALLQRAALALLAGERGGNNGFLQKIGLDELSLSRANTGGVNDTIVSLGKQISKRVYVGYEHALSGTGGTLQLIYRIANRVTLRARTGSENALDAIWTWRWN